MWAYLFKKYNMSGTQKLKTFKVKFSIIEKTFRTIEIVAFDYNDCKVQFEKKTGLPKRHILSITDPNVV